jgi:predicted GNAT family acetyltransferase
MEIVDNERKSRFEAAVDGQVAELIYRRRGNRLVLVHTGVPESLEGRGIGAALVTAAIGDARARRLTVVVQCPFARSWLRRHPDAADGVDIDWRGTSDDDA